VGGRLAGHLIDAGAQVLAFDPHPQARDATADAHPDVNFASTLEELLANDVDVLSPNALGGLITADLARSTSAQIICGGANNQLAEPAVADILAARGITYAPDFMVNCGGVIQVAEELQGGDLERARARTEQVHATTLRVLERARLEGVTPVTAAEAEAEERIRRSRAAQGQVV
jgi:valine dehydrogenase (NAD+)